MNCSSPQVNDGQEETRLGLGFRLKRLSLAIAIGLQSPILAGVIAWFWADSDSSLSIMLQASIEVGVMVSCFLSHRILPEKPIATKRNLRQK